MSQPSDLIQLETARALVYRGLADAYGLPRPEWMHGLEELTRALALLGSGAQAEAAALEQDLAAVGDRTTLEIDFARLFAGPFLILAPPYGSIYLEGVRRLMGDSTMAVQAQYRDLGLDLAPGFKEAPDHIAAELEFLHVLVCQEVTAIQEGDRRLLQDSLQRQQTFLTRHLGQWVEAFAAKVSEHAATAFYRRLAGVTRGFIAEDCLSLAGLRLPSAAAAPLQA
jgi:TorA maturation chaperone TorD